MDILDDMGVSKLSVKVFFKVNYSFKWIGHTQFFEHVNNDLKPRLTTL